jgi:hypothetical protein
LVEETGEENRRAQPGVVDLSLEPLPLGLVDGEDKHGARLRRAYPCEGAEKEGGFSLARRPEQGKSGASVAIRGS